MSALQALRKSGVLMWLERRFEVVKTACGGGHLGGFTMLAWCGLLASVAEGQIPPDERHCCIIKKIDNI